MNAVNLTRTNHDIITATIFPSKFGTLTSPGGNFTNDTLPVTTVQHHYYQYYAQWNYLLRYYSLYVCTVVGIFGNGISFLVFMKSNLRKSATGVYVVTLAWVDSFVLVTELLARMQFMAISDIMCKIIYHARYSLKLMEALIVVTLCADRTACLRFPFQAHKVSNLKVAKVALLVITLLSFTACIYALFFMVLDGPSCNISSELNQMTYMYTDVVISVIFGELLTSLLVILMAVYIIREITKLRQTAQLTQQDSCPRQGVDRQVTRMTAAVAVTFTITRLPYSILYVTYFIRLHVYGDPWTSDGQQRLTAAVDFWSVVALLNYSTNFFIYLLFWRAFRLKLLSLVACHSRSDRSSVYSSRCTGHTEVQLSNRHPDLSPDGENHPLNTKDG